jgi:hypothetical protein
MLDNERLAAAMHTAAMSGSAIHLNLDFTGLPEAVIFVSLRCLKRGVSVEKWVAETTSFTALSHGTVSQVQLHCN